jgi:hypothetical protein
MTKTRWYVAADGKCAYGQIATYVEKDGNWVEVTPCPRTLSDRPGFLEGSRASLGPRGPENATQAIHSKNPANSI